jgi:predicted AAA+ superfamily ATPase
VDLESIDNKDLYSYESLYKHVTSRLCRGKKNYVIIDEVQNCRDFQKAIDSLYIKNDVDLYITGSNAHILSGELATLLSGRYITIELLPFSFKEYIAAVKNEDSLEKKFRDYIRYGAFPYVPTFNGNEKQINNYLEGLYNTVFKKDIIERYKISDAAMLEDIIKFLFDNIGNPVSSNKISNTLTSNHRKISQPTVENYLSFLANSYLLYKVGRYDIKGKEYLKSLSKYYIADIGLRNYLLGYKGLDRGRVLENIIYLELRRRGYKIYTGKVGSSEVDFIATLHGQTQYYQIAQTVSAGETLERELAPLRGIKDFNQRFLITLDYDANKSYDGIKHLNALEFLTEK